MAGEDILSLIRVELITGRTHQIRVQFSSRKMPLMGDVKYGGKRDGVRLALWSCRIGFKHPFNDTAMNFVAEPPKVFPWNDVK